MYYELCQRYEGKNIKPKRESVTYSIDQLILFEAECFADMHADNDAQWELMVQAKQLEVWRELATKGIYHDENGIPRFIKMEKGQKLRLED